MTEGARSFARRKLRDARGSLEAARALLGHTLTCAASAGEVVICAPPASDAALLADELGLRWIRQTTGSLGARIGAALASLEEEVGPRPVLLIGDDCAGLSEESMAEAVIALARGAESVIGRARDGGFWLLGLLRWDASFAASLAANVEWSTPRAFVSLKRFLEASFPGRPALLAELGDIDAPEDLADAVRVAEDPALRRLLAAVRPGLPPLEADDDLLPFSGIRYDGRLPRPPPRA